MKTRILLCMMALWAICSAAQPVQHLQPSILEDGCHKLKTSTVKMMKAYEINPTETKRSKAHANQQVYQINFDLDFDVESQKATTIIISNKENWIENSDQDIWELPKGITTMSVPAGTYDIIVKFWQLDTTLDYVGPLYYMNVVREQVTVDQNLTMHFAASEAKNHIHFQTLTIDGKPAHPSKYYEDSEGNSKLLEQGNVDVLRYNNGITCCDLPNHILYSGYVYNDEGIGDIFINDVSDRYSFYSYRVMNKNSVVYTSACEIDGRSINGDTTVSNDPSKYKLFQDPFLTPQYQNEEKYPAFRYAAIPKHGNFFISSYAWFDTPLAEGDLFKCYIGVSADDCNTIVPYFEPSVSIEAITTTPWGEEEEEQIPILSSMPLINNMEHTVFANNGTATFLNDEPYTHFELEYSDEIHEYINDNIKIHPRWWPSHPAFTYPIENKKDILGNNCPILICNPLGEEATYSWTDENGTTVSASYYNIYFDYDYIGRYGERHPQDVTDAEYTIKVNGEDFASGHGFTIYTVDVPFNGVVDASINNNTVIVDDLIGSNKATLHYTVGVEDENPPTVTMLHFKDGNEDVTDRFFTATDGTLEFSAGDFNLGFAPKGYPYFDRQAPESVEVSYSPYGEDNWNELTVEEVPENYWPLMGWFYSGSLAGVTGEGLNGWFDLKIRLTDAAGNWQEQVLSPAFRLDDHAYSSVATLHDNNAYEVARYNLAGQRVDANATGIVIIKMSDGTARKEMVK